jgi:hypothetical protein
MYSYVNCTKEYHCDISIDVHNVFWSNSPLYPHPFFIPIPSFPFTKQYLVGFITYLYIYISIQIHMYAYVYVMYFDHIHSQVPCPSSFPFTDCPHPSPPFTLMSHYYYYYCCCCYCYFIILGLDSPYDWKHFFI